MNLWHRIPIAVTPVDARTPSTHVHAIPLKVAACLTDADAEACWYLGLLHASPEQSGPQNKSMPGREHCNPDKGIRHEDRWETDPWQSWSRCPVPTMHSHHSRTWGVAGVTDSVRQPHPVEVITDKDLEHYTLTQLTNQERALRTGNVEATLGDAPVRSTSGRECAKALGSKNT